LIGKLKTGDKVQVSANDSEVGLKANVEVEQARFMANSTESLRFVGISPQATSNSSNAT